MNKCEADSEVNKVEVDKFEVDRAEKVEVVEREVAEDSEVRMPKLKQTPRKRKAEFTCHVCQAVFSQKYNRKRHLAKHGVNEKGEKLTQDEQDRLLGYNRHKDKQPKKSGAKKGTSTMVEDAPTSKGKSKYKSVEFLSSTDSSSSSDEDSSSDSESDTSICPVAAPAVPASTSTSTAPHTLTASEIAEAAKQAVERVGYSQSLSALEIAERAIGLYLSETDKDIEEGELVSDDAVAAVQTKLSASQPPSSESKPEDDPCVRKATKPAKVFAPKPKTVAEAPKPLTSKPTPKSQPSKLQKLKTQLQPFTTPAPTIEQAQQAMRRTKSVTTQKLVRQAVKLEKSAVDIADKFASEYSLKPDEKRQVIRQVRIARMSQRSLAHKIRRIRWKFTKDGGKREFIEWLDHYLSDIEDHSSESDEPSK